MRVTTFNIRYEGGLAPNEDPFHIRLPRILARIREAQPDVILWQEANPDQHAALRVALPEFADVGLRRDPDAGGGLWGEPIFYRRRRCTRLLDAQVRVSRDIPCQLGPYPFGRFETRATLRFGLRRWTFLNLHLCPSGSTAKRQQHLAGALDWVSDMRRVVVGGDMNMGPFGTRPVCEPRGFKSGNQLGTFNSFLASARQLAARRIAPPIDMIYVGPDLRLRDSEADQWVGMPGYHYASDHWSVNARIAARWWW